MHHYSDFFKTLHDETSPTGTHCSVLRAVVFHDPIGTPLPKGQNLDFAVIWDENPDVRMMNVIEEIYRLGMLPGFQMFGASRGFFTAILSKQIAITVDDVDVICHGTRWIAGGGGQQNLRVSERSIVPGIWASRDGSRLHHLRCRRRKFAKTRGVPE